MRCLYVICSVRRRTYMDRIVESDFVILVCKSLWNFEKNIILKCENMCAHTRER